MPTFEVIKNADFQLITEFAHPDAKKRLALGPALSGVTAYNIYRNTLGHPHLREVALRQPAGPR
jgi:hypothetical protein